MTTRRRLSDAVGTKDAAAIAASLRKYGYRGLPRPVDVARWLRRQGADIDTLATGPGRSARAPRPRQQAFRQALLAAYGGRCALSGCNVAPALEAAHVADWREENDVGAGILLRADLHRLLESELLAFDARYTVVAAPAGYGEFVGRRLRLPPNRLQWPRLAPCGPGDEAG